MTLKNIIPTDADTIMVYHWIHGLILLILSIKSAKRSVKMYVMYTLKTLKDNGIVRYILFVWYILHRYVYLLYLVIKLSDWNQYIKDK